MLHRFRTLLTSGLLALLLLLAFIGTHIQSTGFAYAASAPTVKPPLPHQTLQGLDSGAYEIVNKNSGLPLVIEGYSTATASWAQQWSSDGAPKPGWTFVLVNSPTSGVYNIVNRNSGKYLGTYGNALGPGSNIIQGPYGGAGADEWTLAPVIGSSGAYEIVNRNFNLPMVIDGYSTAAGSYAVLAQGTSDGAPKPGWIFIPVSA